MKTVLNKKKVPLPQIRISDCEPYTVVPPGVTNPILPFFNPNPNKEGPSEPYKEPAKNKAPSASRKKELTPIEEVEEYLKWKLLRKMLQGVKNEQCLTFYVPNIQSLTNSMK